LDLWFLEPHSLLELWMCSNWWGEFFFVLVFPPCYMNLCIYFPTYCMPLVGANKDEHWKIERVNNIDFISTTFLVGFRKWKQYCYNLFLILLTTLCQISTVWLPRVIGMPEYLKDDQFGKHGKCKILYMFWRRSQLIFHP